VLDQYQPFLAPADRLYEAMNTVDPETRKKRGLLLVEATPPSTVSTQVQTSDPDFALSPNRPSPKIAR
jgi:hypothetical protein